MKKWSYVFAFLVSVALLAVVGCTLSDLNRSIGAMGGTTQPTTGQAVPALINAAADNPVVQTGASLLGFWGTIGIGALSLVGHVWQGIATATATKKAKTFQEKAAVAETAIAAAAPEIQQLTTAINPTAGKLAGIAAENLPGIAKLLSHPAASS